MGKPDPIVYTSAMELIGLVPDQVLAIGDSLEHDISGLHTPLYSTSLSFLPIRLSCLPYGPSFNHNILLSSNIRRRALARFMT